MFYQILSRKYTLNGNKSIVIEQSGKTPCFENIKILVNRDSVRRIHPDSNGGSKGKRARTARKRMMLNISEHSFAKAIDKKLI